MQQTDASSGEQADSKTTAVTAAEGDPRVRFRNLRSDGFATLFLAIVTLSFFWPMLRRGPARMYIVDGDFSRQFFPFRAFEATEWWSGRIPLWNPDMFAGHPFQADIQTGVFYPIALANAIIFGRNAFPYVALEGEIVVHTFLAAIFTYLLARKLTNSTFGGLLAAVAFGFGGFITSYPAQQLAVLETAVWLPLIVLFLELAVETPIAWRWLATAAVAFGIALLAGHPQTDLFVVYATEGYLVWRLVGQRVRWNHVVAAVLAFPAIAGAVAAIQLIPTVAFLAQSSRADMSYLEAAHGYLLTALPQILVPLWHGEKALSIGIAALLLAVLGAIRAWREPIAYWIVVAVVALSLSTGGESPLFWLLYHAAPGWNLFRDQERVIVLFALSAALLAARGFAETEKVAQNSRPVRVWPIVAGAGALLFLVLNLTSPVLGANGDLRANFGLNALVLVGVGALLLLRNRRPSLGPAVGTLLVLLVAAETFAIDLGNNLGPTLPDPRPRLAATAEFMRRLPEPFRVRGIDEKVFPSNYGGLLGTPTIGGDTPFTLQRMNDLLSSDADWHLWQILNVKFFLSTGDALPGLTLAFQDGPLKTYRMGDSLPRTWAVTKIEVARTPAEARAMILDPGYHPGNIVVLEKTPSFGDVTAGPRPDVKIVQNDPQRVVIDATSSSNAILVLASQYYPDWQANRDGVAVEVFRANYLAMAVELPPGTHRYEFVYRPGPFYVGAGISAVALIALSLVATRLATGRRRLSVRPIDGKVAQPVATTLAVLVVAASFALRIHDLGLPNLTGDEWFMLRNHDQGLAWIVHQAHVFEPHPLIYYIGLAGWIEVAGKSEFAMRFPSVVAGVVLTAAAIGLGRALIGERAGLLAGAIVALNPYQIAESQNARNYAMVTAASAIASLLFLRALRGGRRSDWAFYGIAMIVALNVHYDAALVLAVHVAFVVLIWLGKRRAGLLDQSSWPIDEKRRLPGWWLQTTAVILIVFGIWLAYAWPALLAYNGYFPTPIGLDRVLGRSLATFSIGGVAAIREAIPAFALAAVGWVWLLLIRRSSALFLGLYTLLPILAVGILFLARPMFDERYLIVLAPGFLILLSVGVEAVWSLAAPLGILVSAAALLFAVPLIPPTYASELTGRDDYRSLARWVLTYGSPDDPIVATGYGQANLVGYYLGAGRPLIILDSAEAVAAQLPTIANSQQGTWLLPYFNSASDIAATTLLTHDAVPVSTKWFVHASASYFGAPALLALEPFEPAVWKDSLILTALEFSPRRVIPGEAAALALQLTNQVDSPTPKASLRLIDVAGRTVGQSDSPLTDQPRIALGSITTRLGVFVPPTTPPGRYQLAILLYDPASGETWPLRTDGPNRDGALVVGAFDVGARSTPVSLLETQFRPIGPFHSDRGISLVGADPLPPPVAVGSSLSFRLAWLADHNSRPDLSKTTELIDSGGVTVASATEPIGSTYATSRWTPGQILDDWVTVAVPARTPSGQYDVRLKIDGLATPVSLGSVMVLGPERDFTVPNITHPVSARFGSFATLLGADISGDQLAPGSRISLTLQWGATDTADRRYTVFIHLLDAGGKIDGQVDRVPVEGRRPTDGWVAGEFLRDSYELTVAADARSGSHRLEVGLYDPVTGTRVPVALVDGSTSDHVVIGSVQVQ